jgi:hypothetical protein
MRSETPQSRHKTGSPKSGRINTNNTSDRDENNARALAELTLLRGRLRDENETDLLAKIAICQKPLVLKCQSCAARKEVLQRCKRKWCPCCAKQLAAQRSMELDFIVQRMRSPIFVTLTMKNVSDLNSGAIRELRRAFGKLRHRKFWKSKVSAGIAAVEITNIGNGWHPHLHAVIDCRWLSVNEPAPRYRCSGEELAATCKASACEIERVWSKLLKQESSSVEIMRANRGTIAKEIMKYTVKNEDLVLAQGNIGEMIRALDSCRLMTTFGNAHGQCVKDIRAQAKAKRLADLAEWRDLMSDFDCCPAIDLQPLAMFENPLVIDRLQKSRRVGEEERARRWACESSSP